MTNPHSQHRHRNIATQFGGYLPKFLLLVALLVFSGTLIAHEEPAKTLREKAESEQARMRIAQAGVRSQTLWKHEINDGIPTGKKTKAIVQEYDSNGRLLLISAFKNDTLLESAAYSYNLHGDMITDVDLDASGSVVEANVFTYESVGRVRGGFAFDAKGNRSGRFEHRFDPPHCRIEFVKYTAGDSVDYTIEYSYADHYDLCDYSSAVKKTAGGELVTRAEKRFDSAGRTIEKQVFQYEKDISYTFLYTYNMNGVIEKIVKLKQDGSVETTSRYELNPDGTYAKLTTTDGNGVVISLTSFEYGYTTPRQ